MSYLLLSPIFFASIGIKVVLPEMSGRIVLFSVILMVVAVITKIVGCGLGAKMCKFTNKQAIQVGSGMVSRGEVALIVANKGAAITLAGGIPLMNSDFFGPVVIMIVVTTIITPIILKVVFKGGKNDDLEASTLVDTYTETEQLDLVQQQVGSMNVEMKDKYSGKSDE
jgi:Kef-type K+ transport system membrane component KefB